MKLSMPCRHSNLTVDFKGPYSLPVKSQAPSNDPGLNSVLYARFPSPRAVVVSSASTYEQPWYSEHASRPRCRQGSLQSPEIARLSCKNRGHSHHCPSLPLLSRPLK